MRLGDRLPEIRQRKKWTLDKVSEPIGLAKSTLSKIENERISPSFDVVRKFALGLGIDVPQLFICFSEVSASGRKIFTLWCEGQIHPAVVYKFELLCPS